MAGIGLIAAHLIHEPSAIAAPTDVVATGAGQGGGPHVRTWNPDGTESDINFMAAGGNGSGAYVASGDVTGDGVSDLITATGPGTQATVQVYKGNAEDTTRTLSHTFFPFENYTGGVTIATANVDGNKAEEIIVGSGVGMSATVKVFHLVNGFFQEQYSFAPYTPSFTGGVFVGGTNGWIVTGAGQGGGPHVRVFKAQNGALPEPFSEWFAYGEGFTGGVRVDVGAPQHAGELNVITGAGPGGGPHVRMFDMLGVPTYGVYAFDPKFAGGVYVGIAGEARLVFGAGEGGGPHVKIMQFHEDGTLTEAGSFFAYAAAFKGGVRVAGLEPSQLPCSIPAPLPCIDGSDATTTQPTTTTSTTVKPTTTTTKPTTTTSTSTTSTSTTSTTLG